MIELRLVELKLETRNFKLRLAHRPRPRRLTLPLVCEILIVLL